MRKRLLTLFCAWSLCGSYGYASDLFEVKDRIFTNGYTIHHFHYGQVDSTMDLFPAHKDLIDDTTAVFITADSQSKGRGIWNRDWVSPEGNVFSTLCFSFPSECFSHISWLPHSIGLALYQTLIDLGAPKSGLKIRFSNNIVYDNAKISGSLIEFDMNIVKIGIGINRSLSPEIIDTIDQPAISLQQIMTDLPPLLEIYQCLLTNVVKEFISFKNGISPVNRAQKCLLGWRKDVTVRMHVENYNRGSLRTNSNEKIQISNLLYYPETFGTGGFIQIPGQFIGLTEEGFMVLEATQKDTQQPQALIIMSGEIVPKNQIQTSVRTYTND